MEYIADTFFKDKETLFTYNSLTITNVILGRSELCFDDICLYNRIDDSPKENHLDIKYQCEKHGEISSREIISITNLDLKNVCGKCVGDFFNGNFPKLKKIDSIVELEDRICQKKTRK